jgi:para-nitrobenzyl esterase
VTVVRTAAGEVRGAREHGLHVYLGIPYARAPVREARWTAPDTVGPWDGVRDALAFGPAAPQPERPIGHWSHGPLPATSEDCLSLNVWAPAGGGEDRDRLPVIVWFHGGGWAVGFSGSPVYDGAALARALGAVLVSINYRLGSLGYLNHPSLGANWGMRDQAAALRWVRDNIEAFGGDPARVTLWGQSAGAGSALHLLASALGEGLFARVIAASPPLGEVTVPREWGTRWALALSQALGGRGGEFDLQALRAAPAQAIVDAHEALLATPEFRGTRGGAMPVEDPDTLPRDPRYVPDVRLGVPVMVGTAAFEATFLFRAAGRWLDPPDDQLRAIVAHLPDVSGAEQADELIVAARAAESGLGAGAEGLENNTVLCRIATQQLFAGPVTSWAQARAEAGGEVWRYRVEHASSEGSLGATHTIDVPLVFGTYAHEIGARAAGGDERAAATSRAMVAAWREFVHGEEPWDRDELQIFGAPVNVTNRP